MFFLLLLGRAIGRHRGDPVESYMFRCRSFIVCSWSIASSEGFGLDYFLAYRSAASTAKGWSWDHVVLKFLSDTWERRWCAPPPCRAGIFGLLLLAEKHLWADGGSARFNKGLIAFLHIVVGITQLLSILLFFAIIFIKGIFLFFLDNWGVGPKFDHSGIWLRINFDWLGSAFGFFGDWLFFNGRRIKLVEKVITIEVYVQFLCS